MGNICSKSLGSQGGLRVGSHCTASAGPWAVEACRPAGVHAANSTGLSAW